MPKYYLIEEYTAYDDRPGSSSWKAYDVKGCDTVKELELAILKGSRRNGKLIPAKGLEFKLQLIDESEPLDKGHSDIRGCPFHDDLDVPYPKK